MIFRVLTEVFVAVTITWGVFIDSQNNSSPLPVFPLIMDVHVNAPLVIENPGGHVRAANAEVVKARNIASRIGVLRRSIFIAKFAKHKFIHAR